MWTVSNPSGQRLTYLDNLRLVLIVLVIAHHASQPYGPADWWYVEEEGRAPVLATVATISGAFRMSLFFFVSAYLFPPSYDRHGPSRFLGERFKRFGPPILLGFFVLVPVLMYAYYCNFRPYPPLGFADYYLDVYLGLGDQPAGWSGPSWPDRQFAHLWFLQHLLAYAVLYTGYRLLTGKPAAAGPQTLKTPAILSFVALVSLGTFVLRIWYPVDHWVPMLEFIQTEPADVAQYGAFFVAGLMAYRRGWLATLSSRAGYYWLAAGTALAAAHLLLGTNPGDLYAMGGWNTGSLLWSTVESLLAVSLSLGLLVAFREWVDKPSLLLRVAAPLTFTIYVLHVPVVVGLQYAAKTLPESPLLRYAAVTTTATVLTFAIAWLVRRTPYLRRLL
ncbi:acyltransferase [Kribbella sp. NPDC056861]|uniref:acyltransferase family protein n=1 Tax=Kribbella sp. NPDC056861 TaxID=3154857 RepID=UPI0034302093